MYTTKTASRSLTALGVLIALTFVVGFHGSIAQAAPAGWLWGGTPDSAGTGAYHGIGWIDARGVTVPASDGNLSGYGWTPYYGWLSFNAVDLGGCPSAHCTAYRQGTTIKGWAKFPALSSGIPGMNGWVSLSGSGYGVGNGSPYFWSGDLGWIDVSGIVLSAAPTVQIQFQ